MLKIKNLHVSINDTEILKGIDLTINPGEVHAIMGPNGSGKSTLTNILAGRSDYTISQGSITYGDANLLELGPEERAQQGLFLAFQYPVELPGVSNAQFLKTALNSVRKSQNKDELDAIDFLARVKEKMQQVQMDEKFLQRSINEGFSGGEKKRNEILQMLMLEPKLILLDETDSGLDIDALQIVAQGVNSLRDQERGFLIVTHYQRLLDHIIPDFVHVLSKGQIIKSGDKSLALELEEQGYGSMAK